MRIGLGPIPLARTTRSQLEELAHAAVAASFDAVWVAESRSNLFGGGLAAAAFLAQLVPIRVGAAVDFGADHPLYTAEDIAVADITSRGRIEVLLRGGSREQLRLLTRALTGEHLRFTGDTLRVPAHLEANQPVPDRLALNPRPVQPAVPIWVEDIDADFAREIGVGVASQWRAGRPLPSASGRWPGMVLCPGDVSAGELLRATGPSAPYFLVAATSAADVAATGRRLAGPLRMPEIPEWVTST